MAFQCPHCHNLIKVIPLSGSAGQLETFESTTEVSEAPLTPRSRAKGFWAAEGTNAAIMGLFAGFLVWLYCFWYEYDPLWSVVVALMVGVGLMVLRVVLYAPPRLEKFTADKPQPKTTTIRVEQISEDQKHWLLDDLDDRIALDELRRVAKAIVEEGENFSRPALCKAARISQPKFHLILAEFERLHYVHKAPGNRHILTPRAKAFLRKVASLPS